MPKKIATCNWCGTTGHTRISSKKCLKNKIWKKLKTAKDKKKYMQALKKRSKRYKAKRKKSQQRYEESRGGKKRKKKYEESRGGTVCSRSTREESFCKLY